MKSKVPFIAALMMSVSLAACSSVDRLRNVGEAPAMSPLGPGNSGAAQAAYANMPMPSPNAENFQPNSLWKTGSRAFFKDQRAAKIGDILTVNINIADRAQVNNTTSRTRSNSEKAGLPNAFGIENGVLQKVLPGAPDGKSLLDASSSSGSTGTGTVNRQDQINLTVAAVVSQVLPNGNLVIEGRQEVRVNFEVRELFIAGVVRPEDISNTNTINHTQIAEARVSYGGRGQLTDVQQPRVGQQIWDIIFPF